MAKCVFCGEIEEPKGGKYETGRLSRASLLGPTIDETIIYLICCLSMNLAYKLNLVHKYSGKKQKFRKRETIDVYERKYHKRQHSSDGVSRKSSDSRSHSSRERREHRHRSTFGSDSSVYRVSEPGGQKSCLVKDDPKNTNYSRKLCK